MLNQKKVTINEMSSNIHGFLEKKKKQKIKKARFMCEHISHHSSLHIDYSCPWLLSFNHTFRLKNKKIKK
jgi:galactose mutarotase-like enzyme